MNHETLVKMEQTHGEDAKWVQWLKRYEEEPGSMYELLREMCCESSECEALLEELAAMVAEHEPPVVHEGDLSLDEPLIVLGDLKVGGKLYTSSVLIVLGDLEAAVIDDCGPDSAVAVNGDVRCKMLWTDSEFYVNGDVKASELVYGYYNDNVLSAATVIAPVVVEDDHSIEAEIEAEHYISYESQAPLESVFVEGAYDAERGKLNQSFITDCLLAGKPVRR